MAMIETWYKQDLKQPVQVHHLHGNVFSQDNQGNLIGVEVLDDGEQASLSGTVSASVIRSDGATVPVTGVLSNNKAYVILPSHAYAVPGVISIVIKLTGGGSTTTLCAVVANVYRSSTDTAVDPGTIIPSIQGLIDAINEAIGQIPADYSDLINEVRFIEHDAFVPGTNLFNYRTITKGIVIKTDGTTDSIDTGYTSDYISVYENTEYYKRYVFGSSVVANVVFYDASYNFISADSGSSHTFTTPNGCAYIKICGYISESQPECIYRGNTFDEHRYFKYVLSQSAGGGDSVFLYASYPIVFDSDNNEIVLICATQGTNKIYLHIPGYESKSFDFPIVVTGTGSFLFYNAETQSFIRGASEHPDDKSLYLVSTLFNKKNTVLYANDDEMFITSQLPVLTIDTVEKNLYVNIPSLSYLWYKGRFVALTAESYTLSLNENINCVFFNILTKRFVTTTSFESYYSDPQYIRIGIIYKSYINLTVPYALYETDRRLCGKNIVTYGDSLTWYDGQQFTWGPYQGTVCYGYQSYLRKYLGANVDNQGESGKTTPQISEKIMTDSAKITANNYLILMPSIMNDDRLDVSPGTVQPIGGTFDPTTTAGAMQTAIEYIYSVNPGIRIIIIVQPRGWTYEDGAPHLCNELLPVVIRNVAELYGIPVIDLWKLSGINELTRNTFLADPTFESGDNELYMYHPNNDGWKVLSRIICDEMGKY